MALAQPSAAELKTADAADALGIRLQRADAGEEGRADEHPADQSAEWQAARQQWGINVDKERAGQQQHHAEKLQQVFAQPKFVLNKAVQRLCAQRHQRDGGEDQAGLGAFQPDLLIQPQRDQRKAGRPGEEKEEQQAAEQHVIFFSFAVHG